MKKQRFEEEDWTQEQGVWKGKPIRLKREETGDALAIKLQRADAGAGAGAGWKLTLPL